MRRVGLMCALLLGPTLLWPTGAQAAWLEASSAHFVVYADDSEQNLRHFAERLERYHAAMELVTRRKTPPVSPSNRLTVYVAKSQDEVLELAKSDNPRLNGFYKPRAGASLAVVPPQDSKGNEAERSLRALLHEYAHHFSISVSSFPPPLWLAEGSAEFFASATFKSRGEVRLGEHAEARIKEVQFASQITARDVLDTSDDSKSGGAYLGFYAKSWLLYHYLVFEPRRQGQLAQYLAEITAGRNSLDAARNVFGDLGALDQELDEYAGRRKFNYFAVPADALRPSRVDIRALTAGAAAITPVRIRLRVGADAGQAQELLVQTRTIARLFPSDPAVLSGLAEAEYIAGNDREAVAAADSAIAIDPAQLDAYVQKGLALFRIAGRAADAPAAYARARAAFEALAAREPDHPLPLIYFFRSYLAQGVTPPPLAMERMQHAVELAPFDLALRLSLARQQVRQGQTAAARANLLPVAYDPHDGALAAEARKILASLNTETGAARAGGGDAGTAKAHR